MGFLVSGEHIDRTSKIEGHVVISNTGPTLCYNYSFSCVGVARLSIGHLALMILSAKPGWRGRELMEIPFPDETREMGETEISLFHQIVTTDHNCAFCLACQEPPS